jgi:hypothetical protein
MTDRAGDDLETRLRTRPAPPLPPSLRGRVLAAVERPRTSRWRFTAGLAASLLIGLNLALLAAATPAPPSWSTPLTERASAIREAHPGLSEDEAIYLALHESAGSDADSPWLPFDLAGGARPQARVP